MNAGAYGSETGDVVINATVLDEQGGAHVLVRPAGTRMSTIQPER